MRRSAAAPSDVLYRFGEFILDPVIGRLHHRDDEVVLTRKTFCVLLALVERHGSLVDKDELFGLIWPDTVVEDNNLARCVSMLRKALREHGGDSELVLTVAGRGYQFAGAVDHITRADLDAAATTADSAVLVTPASSPAREQADPPDRRDPAPAHRLRWVAAAAAALTVLSTMAWVMRSSPTEAVASHDTRLWRLTASGSLEGEPTWSPDGRFIAYSSDRSGNYDIWILPMHDHSAAVQVTSGEAREWQPAWSPDGLKIAYRSEAGGGRVMVKPVMGGPEVTVAEGGYLPQWSADSSKLLVHNARAEVDLTVSVYDVATGSKLHEVRTGPGGGPLRTGPARRGEVRWHPLSNRLTFFGNHAEHGWSFWTTDLDGGDVRPFTVVPDVAARMQRAGLVIRHFTWAPNGTSIYVAATAEETENIWRFSVDPASPALIDGPVRLTTGSGRERHVAVSPDGRTLAFSSGVSRTQAWLVPFDAAAGRILGDGVPVSPGGVDADVLDLAPDGRIAYRTTHRGQDELWIADGADVTLLSTERDGRIHQPRWSRDGSRVAYFRGGQATGPDLVVVGTRADERIERPLLRTVNLFEWTDDGTGVIVGCRPERGRPVAVCFAPLKPGRDPIEPVTLAADAAQDLYQARLSPDGRWVSFIGSPDGRRSTVYTTPLGGGPWTSITDGSWYDDKPRWAPDGSVLYYLSLRDGFWNLWGQRIDSRTGLPDGTSFQVSRFYSPSRQIVHHSAIQIGVSADQLLLPLTEMTGAVWILENFDR